MENDLTTKMREAKSCCEKKILSAINEFYETTGLQVVEIDFKTGYFGGCQSLSVEIHTKI